LARKPSFWALAFALVCSTDQASDWLAVGSTPPGFLDHSSIETTNGIRFATIKFVDRPHVVEGTDANVGKWRQYVQERYAFNCAANVFRVESAINHFDDGSHSPVARIAYPTKWMRVASGTWLAKTTKMICEREPT